MYLRRRCYSRKVRYIRLTLYRMVKRVRRVVGGVSQVERICSAAEHTSAMTRKFWDEWRTSKRLNSVYKRHATSPDMDVDIVCDEITSLKRVPEQNAIGNTNIKRCLSDIAAVNSLIAHLHSLAAEKFVIGDPKHEDMLESLWGELLPDVQREGGRVTREWGRLGFQQSEPATDFRGGGILALHQLLAFARSRPTIARAMLVEPTSESARYPWACVGINITSEALKLLDARMLDRNLYGMDLERGTETFHSIYADMFEILHSMWLDANPENILAFPPVMKSAMERVRVEVERTGTLVPPGH